MVALVKVGPNPTGPQPNCNGCGTPITNPEGHVRLEGATGHATFLNGLHFHDAACARMRVEQETVLREGQVGVVDLQRLIYDLKT